LTIMTKVASAGGPQRARGKEAIVVPPGDVTGR
jgi:hypothetical protein